MHIEQIRLENGLNTLFINSKGSTAASVQIWFRAGSALEEKEDQGIAHFLEHMFFKGTKTRPGAAIAHEVESFGGEINAFTSFDYTCYYINTPANHLNETVGILLDMVSNPLFDEKELIPERDVVFEEFRRATDNPGQFNFKEMQKTSFLGGYNHQILGTENNIKNFSRAQLTNFRTKYYNLSNAMLVVSGDLKDRDKTEKIISSFTLPDGEPTKFPEFKLKKAATVNIHHKDVRQAMLTFAINAPEYLDHNAASQDLAVNCLAYGEMSPFYKALVTDTSLASSVSGSTMYFSKGGVHFLRVVFPEANFEQVLGQLTKTYSEVLTNKLKDKDISRIRNQYVASKIYERESLEAYSFSLGHGFAQNGDIHCEEEFIQKIKEAKVSQVNQALSDIFRNPIHLTMQLPRAEKIGDKKKILQSFQEKLNKLASAQKPVDLSHLKRSVHDEQVIEADIKKGVKLLYRQNTMTPTFVLHSYIKGGQSFETEANAGHFQLLARLMTNGYKGLEFDDLKTDLENKSAYLNGFSGKNAYGLTLHGQSEHSSDLFKHFFNTLLKPTIPSKYLSLEKELIFRAFENYKEDPVKQCFRTVNQLVFNGHPYAMEILGNDKTIKAASKKVLTELHAKRLAKSEMVFTYCGDEDFEIVFDKISKAIKELKPRTKEKDAKKKLKPLTGVKKKIEFQREQTHIFIGRPSYKVGTTEDLYIKMLNAYLSGQSSELFVEVRDRQGLCYAVQPLQHTALEAGYWGIYIGAGHDKSAAAQKAILAIIDKLKSKGLSQKEFKRIKKMIDGQNLLNIQTNDDYANFYSIPVLHGMGLEFQHESFETIRNFKHTEFNAFLNKFLDFNWNIIEVGPN